MRSRRMALVLLAQIPDLVTCSAQIIDQFVDAVAIEVHMICVDVDHAFVDESVTVLKTDYVY